MAITNGYCTLAELKQRLDMGHVYTASTLAFVAASRTITDTAKGLARFKTGALVQVSGSASNNGTYTVATGDTAASLITSEALVNEGAGATVTLVEVTDPIDDGVLEQVVTAISRVIDAETGRRFYTTAADETRYYTAEFTDVFVSPDDIISVTSLATDGNEARTWPDSWAGYYELWPENATLDGLPYTRIYPSPTCPYAFPTVRKGVRIIGRFGYAATAPAPIKELCLLLSEQVFKRKDALFGVMGAQDLGTVQMFVRNHIRQDPHLRMMLDPYRRLEVLGV